MTSTPRPAVFSLTIWAKSSALVLDRHIGAEPLAGAALVEGAGGREDARAERLGELDRGGADAARPAMDEDTLARLQGAAVEEIGPYREEGFGDGGRLDEAQPFGTGRICGAGATQCVA